MSKLTLSNHISWQMIPKENFAFVYNIRTCKYYRLNVARKHLNFSIALILGSHEWPARQKFR